MRASAGVWAAAAAGATYLWQIGLLDGSLHWPSPGLLGWLAWAGVAALAALAVPSIRRTVVIEPAFGLVQKILPKVSDTEAQALDAGTVGFDAELFSGTPDWAKLHAIPPIQLTAEEQAFLDGPTEDLCRMIDDWQIRHANREIPEPIWAFAKAHGFLGMLISKDHGGLGFSAQAQERGLSHCLPCS